MGMPITPSNFVVDTLLSQGLNLLAGASKVGKSWMALWLSVCVARGDDVWGLSTRQGEVLYLCLEDNGDHDEVAAAALAYGCHFYCAPFRYGWFYCDTNIAEGSGKVYRFAPHSTHSIKLT